MKKIFLLFIVIVFAFTGCKKNETDKKIKIITSIFPLYDFAKEVGKDKVNVKLLLPPGTESHSYEPTPQDIIAINESDIFIYIGEDMEHWIGDILKSVNSKNLRIIEASGGIEMLKGHHDEENKNKHEKKDSHNKDPHIWLDFEIDKKIVDKITAALVEKDAGNKEFYIANAKAYNDELKKLDADYKDALSRCELKTILYAGHYAFGYMSARYGLDHLSPYSGFSSESEPSPKNISERTDKVKTLKAKYLFYEELLEPKVANVISKECKVEPLLLHAAHNLSKDELDKKITFIQIMRDDLEKLKKGLNYR
jgi:zinc transport system substrate-binding protein